MSSTKQMYEYLTKVHGIYTDKCPHCNKNNIEVWQDHWESCHDCWCELCDPKIEIPPIDY